MSEIIIKCGECGHKNGWQPEDGDEPQCCMCDAVLDMAKQRELQEPKQRPASEDEIKQSLLEVA